MVDSSYRTSAQRSSGTAGEPSRPYMVRFHITCLVLTVGAFFLTRECGIVRTAQHATALLLRVVKVNEYEQPPEWRDRGRAKRLS
jgi:hypothetical protein